MKTLFDIATRVNGKPFFEIVADIECHQDPLYDEIEVSVFSDVLSIELHRVINEVGSGFIDTLVIPRIHGTYI